MTEEFPIIIGNRRIESIGKCTECGSFGGLNKGLCPKCEQSRCEHCGLFVHHNWGCDAARHIHTLEAERNGWEAISNANATEIIRLQTKLDATKTLRAKWKESGNTELIAAALALEFLLK